MNNPGELYLNLRRAIVRTYSKEIVAKEYFTFVSFVAQVLLISPKKEKGVLAKKVVVVYHKIMKKFSILR